MKLPLEIKLIIYEYFDPKDHRIFVGDGKKDIVIKIEFNNYYYIYKMKFYPFNNNNVICFINDKIIFDLLEKDITTIYIRYSQVQKFYEKIKKYIKKIRNE